MELSLRAMTMMASRTVEIGSPVVRRQQSILKQIANSASSTSSRIDGRGKMCDGMQRVRVHRKSCKAQTPLFCPEQNPSRVRSGLTTPRRKREDTAVEMLPLAQGLTSVYGRPDLCNRTEEKPGLQSCDPTGLKNDNFATLRSPCSCACSRAEPLSVTKGEGSLLGRALGCRSALEVMSVFHPPS